MNFINSKSKGFTLIELLVVISIIGMLSSIVLASLNSARAKSRDANRIETLKQIQNALVLYYDTAGHYPLPGGNNWVASCFVSGNWIPDAGNYNWSAGYIPSQAHDPQEFCLYPHDSTNTNATASFAYFSDTGQRYALVARLEDSGNRNTIQNAGTAWFDGITLSAYGWYSRSYAIVSQ